MKKQTFTNLQTFLHYGKEILLKMRLTLFILIFTGTAFGQNYTDGFDYPIGNRGYDNTGIPVPVLEHITDETNTFYASYPLSDNGDANKLAHRVGFKQGTWYNLSDVGSFYGAKDGLHPAEDWNYHNGNTNDGNHANDDVGKPVYAIANGLVVKVGINGSNSNIILKHYLPDGNIIHSLYYHVTSADKTDGSSTSSSFYAYDTDGSNKRIIEVGKTWVKRGDIIARIGAANTHLHFGLRDVEHEVTQASQGLWKYDNGAYYYTDDLKAWTYSSYKDITYEEKLGAIKNMKKDGILDPSDFIDANRPNLFKINQGVSIYAGSPTSPNKITINFELENLPANFSVTNIKIGNESIANSDVSNKNISGSFDLDLSSYTSQFTNQAYDISFTIEGDNYFVGKEQIYFLDPYSIKIDNRVIALSDWYYPYVTEGIFRGLFKGYSDGTFRPDKKLSRGAMAKVVVEAGLKLGLFKLDLNTAGGTFTDVPVSHSYFPYVQTLRNKGWIKSTLPNHAAYNVGDAISTGEFAKILVNAFGFTSDDINVDELKTGVLLGSRIKIEADNPDLQSYLEIMTQIVVLKRGNNEKYFVETLTAGMAEVTTLELYASGGKKIIDGKNDVNRAVMAKVLLNAVEYVEYKKGKKKRGKTLADYTIIGDRFELTANTWGTAPTEYSADVNMASGETKEFGFPSEYWEGEPVFFYWVVDDGEMVSADPKHSKISFTAPVVSTSTEVNLYFYVGTAKGKVSLVSYTITVEPDNVAALPTQQATDIVISDISYSTLNLTWNRGDGQYCIVVCSEYSDFPADPLDNELYTGDSDFSTASPLWNGSTTKVLYTGTGNSLSVAGLNNNQSYRFRVFEYNVKDASVKYLREDIPNRNAHTLYIEPVEIDFSWSPAQVVENTYPITFTATGSNYTDLSWMFQDYMAGTYTGEAEDVQFFSAGQKEVRLTATNATTGATETVIKYVNVIDANDARPDAIVKNAKVEPAEFMTGATVSISCDIANIGISPLEYCYTRVYFSEDDQFDAGDMELTNSLAQQEIAGGAYASIQFNKTLTESVGTKYIIFYTDKIQMISEMDEANNIVAVPIEIVASMPDLTFSSFNLIKTTYKSGEQIEGNYTITGSASNVSIRYYISPTTNLSDATYIKSATISSPNSGSIPFVFLKSYIPDGNYYLIAVIDEGNSVAETNETNNIVYNALTISNSGQPTIQASDISITNITDNSVTLTWVNGNGQGRLVTARESAEVMLPTDGMEYSANIDFISAEDYYSGSKAISYTTGNTVTISGLTANSTYYFSIFEYNGSGTSIDYLLSPGYSNGIAGIGSFVIAKTAAASTEVWKTMINTGFDFKYLKMFDELNGVSVDLDNAVVAKTSDGGKTWQYRSCNISARLASASILCADFYSQNIGIIAGRPGIIYKTTDGGETWNKMNSGTIRDITDIQFIDANNIYASCSSEYGLVGNTWTWLDDTGALLKSTDGGNTWSEVYSFEERLTKINFISPLIGWTGSNNYLYKTKDGGLSWSSIYTKEVICSTCWMTQDIQFINETTGYYNGAGNIYRTNDGGSSWELSIQLSTVLGQGFHFYDENHGVAVSNKTIASTIDGGKTWNTIENTDRLFGAFCLNETDFYAYGYDLLKSEVSGQSVSIEQPVLSESSYCTPATLSVPFTAVGTFNTGSIFKVELSNASGDFTNPVVVGELTSTQQTGNIACEINNGYQNGTNYKVRIVSTDPAAISPVSDVFTITQTPNVVISGLNNEYSATDAAFALAGYGLPTGGTFEVNSVSVIDFVPSTLGDGIHNISYAVTDNGCTASAQKSILVYSANSIIINDLTSSANCAGAAIEVSFTSTGLWESDNNFIVELSDASGSFASPVGIGVVSGATSGTINCALPITSIAGANYKLRLKSTQPEILSNETGSFTINEAVSASVSILEDKNNVCSGESIIFTATPVNGGASPSYQWLVNGQNAGTNSNTLSLNSLIDADAVQVQMTSNAACPYPQTAISNEIQMHVNPVVTPMVDVYASETVIQSGDNVEFLMFAENTGDNPIYQWFLNGVDQNVNSDYFSSTTLQNNDVVKGVITSSEACITTPTAEGEVTLSVDALNISIDIVSGQVGGTVQVPFYGRNVNSLLSGQFTIATDPLVATPVSAEQFGIPGLSATDFSFALASDGKFTFSFVDASLAGNSLADDAVLFVINYQITGSEGEGTSIDFTNTPTLIEFLDGNMVSITPVLNSGEISVLSTVNIAGIITTESGATIKDATVTLMGDDNQTFTTLSDGKFAFTIEAGKNYNINVEKDINILNGISTLDRIFIKRHVLGNFITSHYGNVAIDINYSHTITNMDDIVLQKVILGDYASFTNNKSWRFIDKSYVFTQPVGAVIENYNETLYFTGITTDVLNADFIGVKIGDANSNASPVLKSGQANKPAIIVESNYNSNSKEYIVNFFAQDWQEILGYQFEIVANSDINIKTITPVLAGLDTSDFKTSSNIISVSYVTENMSIVNIPDNELLFTAIVENNSRNASLQFNLLTERLQPEIYTENLENVELTIASTTTGIDVINPNGFLLHQNIPNPANESTLIGVTMPVNDKGTISIFNQTGALVYSKKSMFIKGYNNLNFNTEVLSPGIYFYTYKSDKFFESKKMIIKK